MKDGREFSDRKLRGVSKTYTTHAMKELRVAKTISNTLEKSSVVMVA